MNRLFPRFLRVFAFGLIAIVALAIVGAPQARAALGDAHWLASLLPSDAPRISVWLAIAALNAGAAFYLAAALEEDDED